jgi:hypothetical protein
MELFHEYRNKCLNALIILAERIANGEVLTKNQFESEYFRLADDSKRNSAVFFENVISDFKCPIFNTQNKNHVKLAFEDEKKISVSYFPLNTEKSWLFAALNDRFTSLFLNDEANSLRDNLSGAFRYSDYIDDNWRNDMNLSEKSFVNFPVVLDALNHRNQISFKYRNNDYTGVPHKIEYDERKCRFFAIILNSDFRLKADISLISDITVTDKVCDISLDSAEEKRDEKVRRPVVFTVTDEHNHNAVERAMSAFSVYDHEVEKISDKKAIFKISCYSQELDLLIKEILAFGPDIKVEKPRLVKNKIIDILKRL